MDWRDYIHSDKAILGGKPVFKGTRLSLEHIIELQASGWSDQELYDNYPNLTPESLQALHAFVFEALQERLRA
jgi:uncharacterized protein (DUF433 family)